MKGLILSGGPNSVYEKGAPKYNKKIFDLGVPVLGLCYGQQLMAHHLGGKVKPGTTKEYGIAFMKKERVNVAISAHGNSIRLFRKIMEKATKVKTTEWKIPYDEYYGYSINV